MIYTIASLIINIKAQRNDTEGKVMKKKHIMCGLIVFDIIILLVYGVLVFMTYPMQKINEGKSLISIQAAEASDTGEIVKTVSDAAEKLSIDIALECINENYTVDYFRTMNDSKFFDIKTAEGMTLSENKVYSSYPESNEVKIYGFFTKSTNMRIFPFGYLNSRKDIDLSIGKYLVETENIEKLSNELQNNGMEVSTEVGTMIYTDFSQYKIVIGMFILFMIIAEIFYVFSRSKEYGIRRSMGYSNIDILADELKNNILQLVILPLLTVFISFIVLSVIFDIFSAVIYMEFMLLRLIMLIGGAFMLFSVSVIIFSKKCSAEHIKGFSRNKELFSATVIFKTIVIAVTAVSLTSVLSSAVKTYKMYRTTKASVKNISCYAATELNTFVEDPVIECDKYAPAFLDFYRKMHDSHDLIIANLRYIDDMPEESPLGLGFGVINDNFIDFSKDIYAPDGSKITSEQLVQGCYNYLVPEGYDTSINTEHLEGYISPEQINYITYSAESRFFTFNNETCVDYNGYCNNVVLEVFDPELYYKNESTKTFAALMSSYYSNSMFFRYDKSDSAAAYEQIIPILEETGIDRITVTSIPVSTQFTKSLNSLRNSLIYLVIQSFIFICAFIILLIYSTELYYQNNAKDIALKNITGYSFTELFGKRMLIKTLILPILLITGIFFRISPIIAFSCMIMEIAVFAFLIKNNSSENIVDTLKGE